MNNQEGKLNKQISKYYVEHACHISSTGQVAKELKLETSRISELKGGRRQLTVEQAEIIKRIYGIPSTSEGHWIEGELLSFNDLNKGYIDNGLEIHFAKIIELLSTERFINSIIDRIGVIESSVTGYVGKTYLIKEENKRAGVEQKNKRIVREHKLNLFNNLLDNRKFQAWCDAAIRLINTERDLKLINNIIYEKDIFSAIQLKGTIHWNTPTTDYTTLPKIFESIEKGFYVGFDTLSGRSLELIEELVLICKIKRLVDNKTYDYLLPETSEFCFGKKLSIINQSMAIKEYVVVGKCVWDSDTINKLTEPMLAKSVVGWSSGLNYSFTVNDAIEPEKITHMSSKLFYTEQYQYLIEVELYENEHGMNRRRLLIKIEDKTSIFKELMDIFDHFKVEHDYTMKSIKKSVAANGGYIPSAIYID